MSVTSHLPVPVALPLAGRARGAAESREHAVNTGCACNSPAVATGPTTLLILLAHPAAARRWAWSRWAGGGRWTGSGRGARRRWRAAGAGRGPQALHDHDSKGQGGVTAFNEWFRVQGAEAIEPDTHKQLRMTANTNLLFGERVRRAQRLCRIRLFHAPASTSCSASGRLFL
jgi:hypothetical protein